MEVRRTIGAACTERKLKLWLKTLALFPYEPLGYHLQAGDHVIGIVRSPGILGPDDAHRLRATTAVGEAP